MGSFLQKLLGYFYTSVASSSVSSVSARKVASFVPQVVSLPLDKKIENIKTHTKGQKLQTRTQYKMMNYCRSRNLGVNYCVNHAN